MSQPIDAVTARDLMSTELLMAYEGWSIKRLADFFLKHGISGAPVIASDHELVGMISVEDIFRFSNLALKDKEAMVAKEAYTETLGQNLTPESLRVLAEHADHNCTVNSIMQRTVVKVEMDTDLPTIARLMVEQESHRVYVTRFGVVVGVISSTDVLKVVAGLASN